MKPKLSTFLMPLIVLVSHSFACMNNSECNYDEVCECPTNPTNGNCLEPGICASDDRPYIASKVIEIKSNIDSILSAEKIKYKVSDIVFSRKAVGDSNKSVIGTYLISSGKMNVHFDESSSKGATTDSNGKQSPKTIKYASASGSQAIAGVKTTTVWFSNTGHGFPSIAVSKPGIHLSFSAIGGGRISSVTFHGTGGDYNFSSPSPTSGELNVTLQPGTYHLGLNGTIFGTDPNSKIQCNVRYE